MCVHRGRNTNEIVNCLKCSKDNQIKEKMSDKEAQAEM